MMEPTETVKTERVITEEDKLNLARRKLNTVLADKAPAYFTHMKQWFQMKKSKEMFDAEARKLLTSEQVHYHNEFLIALLNKVGGLAETSVSLAHERAFSYGKNRKQRVVTATTSVAARDYDYEDMPRFDPVDMIEYLQPKSPQGAGCDGVKYVAQEVFLPDQALVVGRFMLAAWDHDLEGVEDDAANIVVVATQLLLKNILTAVIAQRRAYKRKGNMMYDLGGPAPNLWLRNSDRLVSPGQREAVPVGGLGFIGPRRPATIDEMEHASALEMACSVPKENEPIKLTIEDVYQALQANRNIIGSHSVYSVNMERIANMLSHPSKD